MREKGSRKEGSSSGGKAKKRSYCGVMQLEGEGNRVGNRRVEWVDIWKEKGRAKRGLKGEGYSGERVERRRVQRGEGWKEKGIGLEVQG